VVEKIKGEEEEETLSANHRCRRLDPKRHCRLTSSESKQQGKKTDSSISRARNIAVVPNDHPRETGAPNTIFHAKVRP